jgi:hypothetical protein
MSEIEATGVLILLFVLRCLLPALIMFGLGYLMNWLVDRWQREDAFRQAVRKQYCLAFSQFGNRCWSKRMALEGALPAECVNCPIYLQAVQTV